MRFFVSALAFACLVALALGQDTEAPTEAATTQTEFPDDLTTSGAADETTTAADEATTAADETTTATSDVTTAEADDKYTAACKSKYPNESNVTALDFSLGPIQSCAFQCGIVEKKFARGIFSLEIVKKLGDLVSKDDHTPCAPSMECLKGNCLIAQEVDDCTEGNADVTDIKNSNNRCKKVCIGPDGKQVKEIGGNNGATCVGHRKVFGRQIPTPGYCEGGNCVSYI